MPGIFQLSPKVLSKVRTLVAQPQGLRGLFHYCSTEGSLDTIYILTSSRDRDPLYQQAASDRYPEHPLPRAAQPHFSLTRPMEGFGKPIHQLIKYPCIHPTHTTLRTIVKAAFLYL